MTFIATLYYRVDSEPFVVKVKEKKMDAASQTIAKHEKYKKGRSLYRKFLPEKTYLHDTMEPHTV